MNKKIIASLDKEDLDKIEELFEKKIALENLIKIVDPNTQEELYNRLIKDYTVTSTKFNQWWSSKNNKHSLEGRQAYVDFIESTLYVLD